MRIRTAVPAAVAAILLLAPAGAQARTGPALRPFPIQPTRANEPVFTDGARYVVLQPADDLVRVYDVQERSSYDVSVGKDCRARNATPGFALISCKSLNPYGGEWPFLLRLAERRVEPAAGSDPQDSTMFWQGIGRHWIWGTTTSMAHSVQVFLNWRNGKSSGYPEQASRGPDLDIDDPRLRRYPDNVFRRVGSLSLYSREGRLALSRPGTDPLLSRGDEWGSIQLAANMATWNEPGGIVGAYDNARRVRLGWKTGAPGASIWHTSKHVVVYVAQGAGEPGRLVWARVRK